MNWAQYTVADSKTGKSAVTKKSSNKLIFKYPCEDRPKCTNYKVTLTPGVYQIECFGAGSTTGTAGAYTSGILKLTESKTLFLYLGYKPLHQTGSTSETFNSGLGYIIYSSSGGGATDVRLVDGDWYSFESRKSRIMVAAGAGGSECGFGGSGGDLEGFDGKTGYCSSIYFSKVGNGAKQGSENDPSLFGISYRFDINNSVNTNTGGNGYYAGQSCKDTGAGSGGGSSFISGHPGCDAIHYESTEDNITHTGYPNHYSNVVFYNTIMKNGNSEFIDGNGNLVAGRSGSGFAVITKQYTRITCNICKTNKIYFNSILIMIAMK